MAKADGLLPKFLHFQTKIKYTEDHNIEVQLENVADHDWVEVVRCKDCVHLCMTGLGTWCFFHPQGSLGYDDFCSAGERRCEHDPNSSDPSEVP